MTRKILAGLIIVLVTAAVSRAEEPDFTDIVRQIAQKLGGDDLYVRGEAAKMLEGLANHVSRPGADAERASLCRALIHDPTLLMLDEPFASLDMFTREELWLVLQDLWLARKPTVILVTHDLREAVFLADRVLVMSARPGRIIAERAVASSRPRKLDMTYEPYSVGLVHELREHISAARSGAT